MTKRTKILMWSGLALFAAAAGWIAFVIYGPKPAVEEVLPAGAVIYTRLAHPARHWQSGAASEFWKNLASIDLASVLTHNRVPPGKAAELTRMRDAVTEVFKNPVIQKFLQKEIALAVYPDRQGVLVFRLTPSVQAAEFFSRLSDQWGEDVVITQGQYRSHRIVHLTLKKKDTRVKYTRLSDMLFISTEDGTVLNDVIDTYFHRRAPLARDSGFLLMRARSYAGAEGTLYIDKGGLGRLAGTELPEEWLGNAGFTAYGMSYVPGEVSRYKFVARYEDTQAMAPSARWMVSCTPSDNASLDFVPSDAMTYQWSGCYDFAELWQQAKEQLREMPEEMYGQFEKAIEKKGYEDLVPALGRDAGFYLTDVDTQGLFPYPRFLAFIRIKDQARVEESLGTMLKSPLGLVKEETYSQVPIRFVSLGTNMDPGYCFLGGYLLAASSRQLLKKSIDTFHDATRSVKSDPTFTQMGLGAAGIEGIVFLKVGEFAQRLRDLLDWRNKYLSSQVNTISVYKQEGQGKERELQKDLALRENELKKARAKVSDLESRLNKEPAGNAADTAASLEQAVRDMKLIRSGIKTNKARQEELAKVLARNDAQADSAKLFMFNSQNVFAPILRGLETIEVQGMKMSAGDHVIETEWMMK